MAAERTDFVTEVPIDSAKTVLAFVRGGDKPPARDLALAWNNFESYGFGMFVGGGGGAPTPMGESNATMTMAKAEQLLLDCMPPGEVPPPPSDTAVKLTPAKTAPAPTPVKAPPGVMQPRAEVEGTKPMRAGAFLLLLEFLGPQILKWLAGR